MSDAGTPPPHLAAALAAIFETSGSIILGLDASHRVFLWNRSAEAFYQTPRQEALGMDYVATFIAPEHREAVAADIRAVLAGKQTRNFEDDSILPDGTRRTVVWNVSRVLGDAGEPAGVVAIGQDVTELKETEARFRAIFEHSKDGLLLSDASGVVDCNPAALAMLGLSEKSELIGRRPAEFSPPEQPDGAPSDDKSRELGRETLARGEHTFEWVHRRPDGTDVPVEVSVRHAQLAGRRVSVVAWHDLSRQHMLEAERAEMRARSSDAQRLEAVGRLASGVAHDFNNLLAGIRNLLELALDELPAGSTVRDDLTLANRTAERAAGLARQLLLFGAGRKRSAEPDGTPRAVRLDAVVREIEPLLRTFLKATHDCQLVLPRDPAWVHADPTELEQIVLNLAINARDAMPEGGTITVRVDRESVRQWTLRVVDTGIGMDETTRQRALDPFFTTKPVGSGTGLGLSVVYGIVARAGGTLDLTSAPGEGTTVAVHLPHAEAPGSAARVASVARENAALLLVDDDALVRRSTRRLLERAGWQVAEAANGHDALQRVTADRGAFDVVLSDVRMPGMDGLALRTRLAREAPTLPIVLYSAYDPTPADGLAPDAPLPRVLPKPFTREELLAALDAALDAAPASPPSP
jgi:two-component system cell cycle sensor histidine kinase/response regulator CckA